MAAIKEVELTPWEALRVSAKTLRAIARFAMKEKLVPAEFGFTQGDYELFASVCMSGARLLSDEADKKQERWTLYGRIAETAVKKYIESLSNGRSKKR